MLCPLIKGRILFISFTASAMLCLLFEGPWGVLCTSAWKEVLLCTPTTLPPSHPPLRHHLVYPYAVGSSVVQDSPGLSVNPLL